MDDVKILDLFFARAEAAIAEAKQKYGKRLFMTAKNILHSNEDAEECVNDALMKAWQTIPPKRPELLGAYLAKIARNHALNRLEAKTAAKRGGGGVELLLDELGESVPSLYSTERAYEASQVTDAINAFLIKADKVSRAAFVLRYFHGDSIADISTRFNMSEAKIKSILFRQRKKLRLHLEKEGVTL